MSFGFGDLLGNVSRSLANTALNAVASQANRALDPYSVQEIRDVNEVAQYPVKEREACLLLHGPCDKGRFGIKASAFSLILHVPDSPKMFSLFRTDDLPLAENAFILYKESFPLMAACDPAICETSKLDQLGRKLRANPGWTAPHLAAAFGYVKCLKHPRMVARLNEQDGQKLRTPLMVAIDVGNLASVTALLDMKADTSLKDIRESTVFHLAADKSTEIFQLLLDKISLGQHEMLNYLNLDGYTPLHIACNSNKAEIVKLLLNAGANTNVWSTNHGYAVHCTVKSKSVSCLQELVVRNPSYLQEKDLQDRGSPLHWSTGPETLIPLLELGCDPNTSDESGFTPLHHAVRRGCLKSTLNLLCHGAITDIKGGPDEDTPLHVAARLCNRLLMETLIVFGADINMSNKLGHSARHLLCTSPPSQRDDMEDALFVLHGVGAHRCPETKAQTCHEGCRFGGTSNGNPPAISPASNTESADTINNILHAFSLQREVEQRNFMDSDFANGNRNGGSDGGRLLCLDGGGIRGVVLTQMLMVIQQELDVPVIELFDWVAGTSTGGILALALACRKTPLETQRIYMRLKDKVFVGERPYNATLMEEFLKKEFGVDKTMGSIYSPRVMIMTAQVDKRPADLHIFRNYESPSMLLDVSGPSSPDHRSQYVWQAAKVTGAAPTYFTLDHDRYIDGGLIANNPTLDAMAEMTQYFAAMRSKGYYRSQHKIPNVVVSLGTGVPPKTSSAPSSFDFQWPSGIMDAITKVPRLSSLVNLLIDQATQSEGQVVERSRAWCSSIGTPFYRFSPQMSTDIQLDEKSDEKLIHLLWETRSYMIRNRNVILDMKQTLLHHQKSN